MPKKGSTAVKVTFMTMTLVTPVNAVKFDYGAVLYSDKDLWFLTVLYSIPYVCMCSTVQYCAAHTNTVLCSNQGDLSTISPYGPAKGGRRPFVDTSNQM